MIFNLFVVWFLTGLWHGANFTFILWGLMYFVLLVVEKLTGFHQAKGKLLSVFKLIYTMLFVVLGWVLFRAETLSGAWTYLKSMFGLSGNALSDGMFTGYFKQSVILLAIGIVLCTPLFRWLKKKTEKSVLAGIVTTVGLIGLFILSVASLVSSSYNPFIYFNF
jgi:D-alanyl-lipoteichoic acid acyltransferase DltB (MBOAT superfamily)